MLKIYPFITDAQFKLPRIKKPEKQFNIRRRLCAKPQMCRLWKRSTNYKQSRAVKLTSDMKTKWWLTRHYWKRNRIILPSLTVDTRTAKFQKVCSCCVDGSHRSDSLTISERRKRKKHFDTEACCVVHVMLHWATSIGQNDWDLPIKCWAAQPAQRNNPLTSHLQPTHTFHIHPQVQMNLKAIKPNLHDCRREVSVDMQSVKYATEVDQLYFEKHMFPQSNKLDKLWVWVPVSSPWKCPAHVEKFFNGLVCHEA